MKAYWAATPGLARAAFFLAVLAVAHFVGLWLAFSLNPEEGSNPLPGVLLWGTLTGVPFLAIVTLIAIGFRSASPSTIRSAAIGAGVMAFGGVAFLVLVATAPAAARVGGLEYWISGSAALIGLAYAVVAYLGFRAASRVKRATAQLSVPNKLSRAS